MSEEVKWYDCHRAGQTAAGLIGLVEAMAKAAERDGHLERALHLYTRLVDLMSPKAWSDQAQCWLFEYMQQQARLSRELERRRLEELHTSDGLSEQLRLLYPQGAN